MFYFITKSISSRITDDVSCMAEFLYIKNEKNCFEVKTHKKYNIIVDIISLINYVININTNKYNCKI